MESNPGELTLQECLEILTRSDLSPLDLLPEGSLAEKMIGLVLSGPPPGTGGRLAVLFQETLCRFRECDTGHLKVVTLGGGTGLSNIVGGDSRRLDWVEDPFIGLKEIFPGAVSIVCATDDGGSTGELLKELPLIALGDLRHVLLSSIRREGLRSLYHADEGGAFRIAGRLHAIFNHRFDTRPPSPDKLCAEAGLDEPEMPAELTAYLRGLVNRLFTDERLHRTIDHPQCLGNLLLAAAVFARLDHGKPRFEPDSDPQMLYKATMEGLSELAERIGAGKKTVLPCTTVPAQLQVLYSNGVLVTGEYKSSQARRGYPVDRVMVNFFQDPFLPAQVEEAVGGADIIVFAPGSLYSSIIPILQVPGIADLIRRNRRAMKILVSNIWVQKGETDAAHDAPERKFHISDLVRAYNRNIPGGVNDLFSHILTLGMGEIPGSVLQNYALEEKEPIYLDRQRLREIGFEPVEAGIFSLDLLRRRHVIQHDPAALALAVRTLWCLRKLGLQMDDSEHCALSAVPFLVPRPRESFSHPCRRFQALHKWLGRIQFLFGANGAGSRQTMAPAGRLALQRSIADILWRHSDILADHLRFTDGIILIQSSQWVRCQQWDNIFSFYEPAERMIFIRDDQAANPARLEMAFLVALGQSLLGNYAKTKTMGELRENGEKIGRAFHLTLQAEQEWQCYFSRAEVDAYLRLARMRPSAGEPGRYTRLINSDEGFTPPGLLFGLFYAWYLDNRFATHIEYKMSIIRHPVSDLIPEQIRIAGRRRGLIDFFRENVFRHRPVQA
ncbi:MAG: YvcK family protein [Desulfobulbaceae bacterium]|jgi:uncharacterized cofD-like protein|nr:YvcK family protein [Desulfobulbaceae bacterium]